MTNTVNIYDPGWIFFFSFFLILNLFFLYHHIRNHQTKGSVIKYVQQNIPKFQKAKEVWRNMTDAGNMFTEGLANLKPEGTGGIFRDAGSLVSNPAFDEAAVAALAL